MKTGSPWIDAHNDFATVTEQKRRQSEKSYAGCVSFPARTGRPAGDLSKTGTENHEWNRGRVPEETLMKGAQKPKKGDKGPAQKTLKEKRQEKRNAAKGNSGLQ
jgi:hypothetical protein